MCLHSHEKFEHPGEMVAWKLLVRREDGKLYTYNYAANKPVPINIWRVAMPYNVHEGGYVRDFHVYATREDARRGMKWDMGHFKATRAKPVIVKVLIRGVHTKGTEHNYYSSFQKEEIVNCLVAKEMFIPLAEVWS